MRPKLLIALSVLLILVISGCGTRTSDMQNVKPASDGQQVNSVSGTQEPQSEEAAGTEKASGEEVTSDSQNSAAETGKPAAAQTNTNTAGSKDTSAEVVVKTDTSVSDERAAKVLEEIDREMDNLINVLNNMDDISDSDLEF